MSKISKGSLINDILQETGSKADTIVDGKSLFDKLSDLTVVHLEKVLKVCKGLK